MLDSLKKSKYVLDNDTARIRLKVDGNLLSFGLDEKGSFFLQSTSSGPISSPGGFEAWSNSLKKRSSNEKIKKTIEALDETFDLLISEFVSTTLSSFSKFNLTIKSELLHPTIGTQELGEKIRFSTVSYDASKIIKPTLVVFDVLCGIDKERADFEEPLIEMLKSTTRKVKIEDAKIEFSPIDFCSSPDFCLMSDYLEREVVRDLLKRRNKQNESIRLVLNKLKDLMTSKILKSIKPGKFGPMDEGAVVELPAAPVFKVVFPSFVKKHRELKEEYELERQRRTRHESE